MLIYMMNTHDDYCNNDDKNYKYKDYSNIHDIYDEKYDDNFADNDDNDDDKFNNEYYIIRLKSSVLDILIIISNHDCDDNFKKI